MALYARAILFTLLLATIAHGTSVITLIGKDGIVMAADGLEVEQSLAGGGGSRPTEKIAICGDEFLCGMAGINPLYIPIPAKGIKVEYEFQHWIGTIKSCRPCRVSQFADIVQSHARITFRDMDKVFKIQKYWKSKLTEAPTFVAYEIIGYSDGAPEVCTVTVQINRQRRSLIYPKPECAIKTPANPSPTSIVYMPLAGTFHANIDRAVRDHSSEQGVAFGKFQAEALPLIVQLMPHSPPSFQVVVAGAIAEIRAEGKFNPQKVGGPTLVGIVIKGNLPALLHPDN